MKLLTQELRENFPLLYATEKVKENDKKVIAKFFCPWNKWTWYALEFDQDDTFFGYVVGLESEYGYFSLKELENFRGPVGLTVERDIHFKNHTMGEILEGKVK